MPPEGSPRVPTRLMGENLGARFSYADDENCRPVMSVQMRRMSNDRQMMTRATRHGREWYERKMEPVVRMTRRVVMK